MRACLCSSLIVGAVAHGQINIPPSRNAGEGFAPGVNQNGCQGEGCMWFSQGCTIGCPCNGDNTDLDFFKRYCDSDTPTSLNDPDQLTFFNDIIYLPKNWTMNHPWRHPGTALTYDACGLSGGSYVNNDAAAGFGKQTIVHQQGYHGSQLPPISGYKTTWRVNSTVEVAWGITANHGGGYQYRVCPADRNLTEACFQQHVLPFVGGNSTLRWNNGQELEIAATRVTVGTFPVGSEWRKNPIPACTHIHGGLYGDGCNKPQFEPPAGCNETCWGFQPCEAADNPPVDCSKYPNWKTKEIPNIVDRVQLPATITPGAWVVQWRWDCEQTPQVWNGCADVTVVE